MPKPGPKDIEIASQSEGVETGLKLVSTEFNILNWLCHHASQIAKGGAALVGLALLGGVGYFARGAFSGARKTAAVTPKVDVKATDEQGLVVREPAGAVAKSEDLAGFSAETKVSTLHNVTSEVSSIQIADGGIDFGDAKNAEVIEEIVTPGVKRSLMQLPDDRSALAVRDNSLTKIWAKAFTGVEAGDCSAYSIQQTTDGGYIVVGSSLNMETRTMNCLIFKLDGYGNKVWAKTFDGSGVFGSTTGYFVQEITDGGYIVAGSIKTTEIRSDYLILKLDSFGTKVWAKTFGDSLSGGVAYSIKQTTDGGYIVAGCRGGAYETYDCLILKLDSFGTKVWAKTFGDEYFYSRQCNSIQQTMDGGYIVTGADVVLKLDGFGTKVWTKTFGDDEDFSSIQQTMDGGYIVGGTMANGMATEFGFLILKLDNFGTKVWAKTFGGSLGWWASSIQQTMDGGYIVAGSINPVQNFILKLDSFGTKVWAKFFDYHLYQEISFVRQTTDGGYIAIGRMDVEGNDFAVVFKLDVNGTLRSGCKLGQDISLQTVDASLTLMDITWEIQNATLTLASADAFTLADLNFTTNIICVRNPVVNIPISTQTSCCEAWFGQTYSFVLANSTFIDPEGEVLTFAATLDGGGMLPGWLRFDPMIPSFNGVPGLSAVGNLAVNVIATNQDQSSVADTFTLNVAQTLTATNISAIINYIENTEYQLAAIVITTPNANVTATLTLSNITAGNFTTGTSGSVTSTFNPTTGVWQASGNLADVNYLLAGLKYRPAFDYHGGFSIAVKIDDSLGQSLNSTLIAPALAVPTLVYNPFTILIGGSVVLTPSIISAEDTSVPASALVFTVSNMQHGRFELAGAPGTAITTFTKQQIINGQVKIVQDNSDNAPQFNLKVDNGAASSPSTNIISILHHNTVLITAEIRIGNGESLVINLNMLNARNPDDTPEQLTFSIVNIQNGRFEFLDNPGIIINQFTLREIIDGRVRLGHDASSNPPIFSVSVSDAFVTTTPVEVRTKFKENAPAPDGTPITETFRNIAVGAAGSGIAAVGFWVVRKKYSTRKKRKTYPLEDGIRRILNLGVSDFDSAKGKEFLQTIKILAKKLQQEQGINTKTLTHEELRGLADPMAKAIRRHGAVKTRGRGIFRSNSIDHDKVRNVEVSEIAQDVAAMWRDAEAVTEVARPMPGELPNVAAALSAPLLH